MNELRFPRFGHAPQVAALPFLAFGLVLALWMPTLILQATPDEDVTLLRWAGFGIAAVGLLLGSLRGATTIDVARSEVVAWWGFGLPWRRQRWPLSRFDRVTIEREAPGESGMRFVYPVLLKGEHDAVRLLGGTRHLERSRAFADRVSSALGVPVEDASRL